MKETTIAIACALAIHLAAGEASATDITLAVGDPYYVGTIVRGDPSDPASELSYITNLITLAAGVTTDATATPIRNEAYTRAESSLSAPLPEPGAVAVRNDDGPFGGAIDLSGSVYILAKYSTSSLVWLVRDIGPTDAVALPQMYNRRAISHYTIVAEDVVTSVYQAVPDGGVTLMLLGAALVGLATLRSRLGG